MSSTTPNPLLLIAELTYLCPLHCSYCSNPLDIAARRYRNELTARQWSRVFEQAADLGILQVGLTGGEPLARPDIVSLTKAAASNDLYSTLVTAGVGLTRERAEALLEAGLDHVQISIQDSDSTTSDRIAGASAFSNKLEAAAIVTQLGLPLTINTVLHRGNLDRIGSIIDLAEQLGARRLELANAQYQGWALLNRKLLLPTRDQVEAGEALVRSARRRLASKMEILWVLPDYYEDVPKPCMGGWGSTAIVVAPDGSALPCHAATSIPGLQFENVQQQSLNKIWFGSTAFERFRGTDWMQEPCRSCPLGRQEVDFGGCRCQALALAGNAAAADPVCRFSPRHKVVLDAQAEARDPDDHSGLARGLRQSAAFVSH